MDRPNRTSCAASSLRAGDRMYINDVELTHFRNCIYIQNDAADRFQNNYFLLSDTQPKDLEFSKPCKIRTYFIQGCEPNQNRNNRYILFQFSKSRVTYE